MARDFIRIDSTISTATQAQELKALVSVMRDAYQRGKKILAVMGHSNDGTVFTDIEALYGLPTGKGQTVFNLINGAVGSMEGTFQVADAKNLTETVG
jgi:hypothetical protein